MTGFILSNQMLKYKIVMNKKKRKQKMFKTY